VDFTNLFEYQEAVKNDEPIKTESSLTRRQHYLYRFLKEFNRKAKQEELIEAYEIWLIRCGYLDKTLSYNYYEDKKSDKHFSNYTSARNYRKDFQALKWAWDTQKVFATNKIANSVEEAVKEINSLYKDAKKKMALFKREKDKLQLNGNYRLVFNKEKTVWESVLIN
jgi:hypothetical protein